MRSMKTIKYGMEWEMRMRTKMDGNTYVHVCVYPSTTRRTGPGVGSRKAIQTEIVVEKKKEVRARRRRNTSQAIHCGVLL
jgi:hypothetical protein